MDIHHLRIFCEVYQRRSFSQASQQLHITQPTVSSHIKTLEQELECSLFDRLGQSILPTVEAEALYPLACRVLDAMNQLREELSLVRKEIKGQIVIGASTIPGTYILPSVMSRFRRQYPEVAFEILVGDSREIMDRVLAHELFLGIVGVEATNPNLNNVGLCTDELVLAASPELAAEHAGQPPAALLRAIPFLLREEGSGTRRNMERYLKTLRLRVADLNVVAVLGSTASVLEGLRSGLGGSILSRTAIADPLARGEVVTVDLPGLPLERRFHLISHKKRSLPNLYRVLADFLTDNAGPAPPGCAETGRSAV